MESPLKWRASSCRLPGVRLGSSLIQCVLGLCSAQALSLLLEFVIWCGHFYTLDYMSIFTKECQVRLKKIHPFMSKALLSFIHMWKTPCSARHLLPWHFIEMQVKAQKGACRFMQTDGGEGSLRWGEGIAETQPETRGEIFWKALAALFNGTLGNLASPIELQTIWVELLTFCVPHVLDSSQGIISQVCYNCAQKTYGAGPPWLVPSGPAQPCPLLSPCSWAGPQDCWTPTKSRLRDPAWPLKFSTQPPPHDLSRWPPGSPWG